MSLADKEILYANAGTQATDDDKRLFVTFSFEARLNRAASTEEGRNVYKDVEYVTINIPGDKTFSVHRPVKPSDKVRFPLQYAAFKNAAGEQIVGTPLRLWPGCTPSQVKELEYFNVRTVEQLASMPDGSRGSQLVGVQALRNAARNYVENAKSQAPLIKVQDELKARDAQIAALQDQITRLAAAQEKASKAGK